jgi:hypothetical protein
MMKAFSVPTAKSADSVEPGVIHLLDYFEFGALSLFGANRVDDGSNGSSGSAAFANHFANVRFGYPQLVEGDLVAINLGDIHFAGIIYQSFNHEFNEIFHKSPQLWDYSVLLFPFGSHFSADLQDSACAAANALYGGCALREQ